MAKLNANTAVMRPDTLEVVTLAEGDDVPEWAVELVGEHLVDMAEPKRTPARKATAKRNDEG